MALDFGVGLPFSSASSSGISEPELTALAAARPPPTPLTNPQVASGCSGGRAARLMHSRGLPPNLYGLPKRREIVDAGVETRSHQNAPSVASDSSSCGQILSEERKQALLRTLDSVGIVLPPNKPTTSGPSSSRKSITM